MTEFFLRRSPEEIRINYNSTQLKIWQASIDLQYVLNPYACAKYILSYITKDQKGMSKLRKAACQEARDGNLDIRQQIRHIGNKFLNAVEISTLEAVYLTLQMPLRRSSRSVDKYSRTRRKSVSYLMTRQILPHNLTKRYQRRPKTLSNMCYPKET